MNHGNPSQVIPCSGEAWNAPFLVEELLAAETSGFEGDEEIPYCLGNDVDLRVFQVRTFVLSLHGQSTLEVVADDCAVDGEELVFYNGPEEVKRIDRQQVMMIDDGQEISEAPK